MSEPKLSKLVTFQVEKTMPRVVVYYDQDPEEPEMDCTTILHWHKRKGMHSKAIKVEPVVMSRGKRLTVQSIGDSLATEHDLLVWWPLFMYDHGGTALSVGSGFSCSWDSGQVGIVGMTSEQWKLLSDDPWADTEEQKVRAL